MKMITPKNVYDSMKIRDKVDLQCASCEKHFRKNKREIEKGLKMGKDYNHFCSRACLETSRSALIVDFVCGCCGETFKDKEYAKRVFCSKSCAAKYNNTHKTTGVRVSKLEKYISEQLLIVFPSLEFHFNRKDTINSELDIYVPSLKLAFELNGVFHYEPIYGPEKLAQIQNNDGRKYQACLEKGIELCIIDSSKVKYFKETLAKPYLTIIVNIIDNKLKH